MHRSVTFVTALALAASLAAMPARTLAHGEVDEAQLAEFHKHLDDYQADVQGLVTEADAIVQAHAAGRDVSGQVNSLIEQWEEVGVHAAIETRATITYPGVWQALIGLQQAVAAGKPADDIARAGERVEAALWQGFGAVRLAASQVGTMPASARPDAEPASGPEAVQQIIADLDQAVAAYEADELQRAEALIHETYMTRFEGLEGDLIERDAELVSSLERDFNATLPLLMQQGAPMEEVQTRLEQMKDQLRAAGDILAQVERSRSEVF